MHQGRCLAMLSVLTAAVCAAPAPASQFVVPSVFENVSGGSIFVGPHAIGARKYQLLMHEDLLTGLVGKDIVGISWRLAPSASSDWPSTDVTYSDYEVYFAPSVAPSAQSTTFADNYAGTLTQVRDGPFTVPAGSLTSGGDPNDFGAETDLTAYTYTGGHLLMEIRHVGNGDSSRSIDAILTSHPDYGTMFGAVWSSDLNAPDGFNARFGVFQLTTVPAPGTLAVLAGAALCGRRRRR